MDILGLKYKAAIYEKRADIATSELNNEQKTNEMYKVITARARESKWIQFGQSESTKNSRDQNDSRHALVECHVTCRLICIRV